MYLPRLIYLVMSFMKMVEMVSCMANTGTPGAGNLSPFYATQILPSYCTYRDRAMKILYFRTAKSDPNITSLLWIHAAFLGLKIFFPFSQQIHLQVKRLKRCFGGRTVFHVLLQIRSWRHCIRKRAYYRITVKETSKLLMRSVIAGLRNQLQFF